MAGVDRGEAGGGTPLPERLSYEAAYEASEIRDADFVTLSGIPLAPAYGPDDAASYAGSGSEGGRERWPGIYPYDRGPYASMYRSKLWTMRMFAGFGAPVDTNRRFKEILSAGGNGLSVAFDLPTLMGRDSDDPHSLGEVGRCGVAIDTLLDMEELFAGIDLGSISTSMTINSCAIVIFAMYVAAAENAGSKRGRLSGTLQNDILKEYQAQKEYRFPPRQALRLVVDVVRFCESDMPRFHPVSVSGYHIREAGSNAVQELAFTLANGFAYVEAVQAAGLPVDSFAPRLSFFFNAHIDFFEEIAKYRAARRIWARWMKERYGARDPRSLQCRFHVQTAGVSLTAQQPEVNVARTAIEALAGVMGGAQSLHTNSMDEVLALPTERAARIALRTQQVIAYETGVPSVADPLGGSWLVERLTGEMERRAGEIFAEIEQAGSGSMLEGVLAKIDEGWFQHSIADSAFDQEERLAKGRRIMVGVNAFTEGNDDPPPPILRVEPEVEELQRKRLAQARADRSADGARIALESLARDAADPTVNLVPAVIAAVRAGVTVGEVMYALASVFGSYEESATL